MSLPAAAAKQSGPSPAGAAMLLHSSTMRWIGVTRTGPISTASSQARCDEIPACSTLKSTGKYGASMDFAAMCMIDSRATGQPYMLIAVPCW